MIPTWRKDIDNNIYNTIYPQIPIDLVDLEVEA